MGKTTEGQDFPKKPLLRFWHLQRCAYKWVFVLKYQHLQFGGPATAGFTLSFCSLQIAGSPLSQVKPKRPIPRRAAGTGKHWYAEHTVTLYRSLLEDCAVCVPKPCFCFKPHCHSDLPCSSLWCPGVTGSFSPTSTHSLILPTAAGPGSLAPPEIKQCSQGQQRAH